MNTARADNTKSCIALIGFRGSGKTAVGRALGELLGGTHVDTDDLVVERALTTIAHLFKTEGEAGFRRRESDAISQIVARTPAVVSVGGGAILDEGNVRKLCRVATMVWLTAPAVILWHRIKADPATGTTRPALSERSGLEEVEQLLAERSPLYERAADLTFDASRKGPMEVARDIAVALGRLPAP